MGKYILMNKNFPILEFSIKETPIGTECFITGIPENPINSDVILPAFPTSNNILKTNIAADKKLSFNNKVLLDWLEYRNYAKHKAHLKKWLKDWGMDTVSGFLDVSHALSLNDTLWVKRDGSDLDWDSINLYDNKFNDVAAKTAFETGLNGLELSDTSPEFTMEGSFPKCWIKKEDSIYLYKTGLSGAANYGLEPNSEFISSYIARQILKDNVLEYNLVKFKNRLCSVSKLFTNKDEGFISFSRILKNENLEVRNIRDIIDICSKWGYETDAKNMFLIDSIVMNQDRHLGNFGFIIDNNTGFIKRFAPLFDFNISMLTNAMDADLDNFKKYEEEYQLGHKLGGTFSDVGKYLMTSNFIDMIPQTIKFPIHDKYNLDESRQEKIIVILEDNLKAITGKNYYQIIPTEVSLEKEEDDLLR